MNKKRKDKDYLKQIEDYYPLINPDRIQDITNTSIPSEEDIQEAKDWVDHNQK